MANYLRSCGGCSAHLLSNDPSSQTVFCATCRPKYVQPFDQWAASLAKGDRAYVRPYLAWHGLSHSENLVISRQGDDIEVQILGLPESRQVVAVTQLGQHDMTPRSQHGAAS